MLPSQSGDELLLRSFCFDVTDHSHVGEVRRCAATLSESLNFSEVRASRLAIVVNELSTNLYRHADGGRILLRAARQLDEVFVEIISIDKGPGMGDLKLAFTDGVTSKSTLGGGLGAIRRQSDVFDVESYPNGTIFVCEIHANDESAKTAKNARIRISGICLPVGPETVSGDAWSVRKTSDGVEILAVDGLGHGPDAHLAGTLALDSFTKIPLASPLERILEQIHMNLKKTRGAAVSLARLAFGPDSTQASIDFTGVGNVRGVICEQLREKTLLTHPGTAGLQYRPKPVLRSEWSGDGAFVMHSDGLRSRWGSADIATHLGRHPGILVGALFRDYTRGTDDISVVAMSFFEARKW